MLLIFIKSFFHIHRGAHYDAFLKFEHRKYWSGVLINYLGLSSDAFIAPKVQVNLNPRADLLKTILEHYSLDILSRVKSLYKRDIEVLGYSDDVALLEELLFHKNKFIEQNLLTNKLNLY